MDPRHDDDNDNEEEQDTSSEAALARGERGRARLSEEAVGTLADQIEHAVFRACANDSACAAYRQQSRRLIFNLRDQQNQRLRARVLDGLLGPAQLAQMRPEDLESAAHREARKSEEAAANALAPEWFMWIDGTQRCPQCGAHSTQWRELRSTRDIGKSETWGNKDAAGGFLRFRCKECGHKWDRDA